MSILLQNHLGGAAPCSRHFVKSIVTMESVGCSLASHHDLSRWHQRVPLWFLPLSMANAFFTGIITATATSPFLHSWNRVKCAYPNIFVFTVFMSETFAVVLFSFKVLWCMDIPISIEYIKHKKKIGTELFTVDCTIAQAVWYLLFVVELQIHFWVTSCAMHGGCSGTGASVFTWVYFVFSLFYHYWIPNVLLSQDLSQ